MTVPDVVVNLPSSVWTTVAAVATCVGALGSATGAIAAWRAASKSSTAAERARAALGAAMRPHVLFLTRSNGDASGVDSEPTTVHGVVINHGSWDAAELHVAWHLIDGTVVEDSRVALARTDGSFGGTQWLVDLDRKPPAEDQGEVGTVSNSMMASASTIVDRVELEMWDAQHLQQWRVVSVRPRDSLSRAWGATYTPIG